MAPANVSFPSNRAGVRHGWHCQDAVQIPTSLTCNQCPLYHVKRKDRRHPLSCPEGRKNQVCPILTRLQLQWGEGLISEVHAVTGGPPLPSDNARIEQIIRHRSKIFQIENYLKVAGLIDLRKGEIRNVADRLTMSSFAGDVATCFRWIGCHSIGWIGLDGPPALVGVEGPDPWIESPLGWKRLPHWT
ncbi:MAG: hypothetical protein ACE5HV_16685 [Acidobacteriota bacterium]